MPEVAFQVGELEANFARPANFAFDEDDAALALFLSDAIHKQDGLTAFELGCKRHQATVRADSIRCGDIAEGAIVWRAAVDAHRNA